MENQKNQKYKDVRVWHTKKKGIPRKKKVSDF